MPAPTSSQIERLTAQGCTAADWSVVSLDPDTDVTRIRNVQFAGPVTVGANAGTVAVDGVDLPCGLYDATLADCTIGAGVRVARIGSVVARCDIGDGAVVQDVAALTASPGSTFGAGAELEAVNEGGGRIVRLLPELSAQAAWMQVFRKHSMPLAAAWSRLVDAAVEASRRDRGRVGEGARVLHCGVIRDVQVGPHAVVRGASLLEDGTILSCAEHPAEVGQDVQGRQFVVAEGASVTGGVVLDRTYVGQATRIGKQFSAENCLFFANCEAFHGEALAAFAGPYTVTHHKSSLLVAAAFSFYNAGSGTNQSNHMYKLGPVHQGVFERGTKTGSFSYVLHETHVGAFSVVIGKHYTNINTPDLPFSNIHEAGGRSELVPAMNLAGIGTVRDGEKWPKRDRRKAPVRRDRITFDIYSPYTVQKMRAGRDLLENLYAKTPKERSAVVQGGVVIKRVLLRTGARDYAQAVIRYLAGRVLDRIESAGAATWSDATDALREGDGLKDPFSWVDVGGQLMPVERLHALEAAIVSGEVSSLADVEERLDAIAAAYPDDEWAFVCAAFGADRGAAPAALTPEEAVGLLDEWQAASASLLGKVLNDARSEFTAASSHVGYGLGMTPEERAADFEAVRGSAETNAVVQKIAAGQTALEERAARMRALIGRL